MPKIRVNAVAPGWIETAMIRPAFNDEEYEKRVIDSIPLKRIATTDDIALSICFLCQDGRGISPARYSTSTAAPYSAANLRPAEKQMAQIVRS